MNSSMTTQTISEQQPTTITITEVVSTLVVITSLAGDAFMIAAASAYQAGAATRAYMTVIDESKIFSRPIWEVPMELINRAVAQAMPKGAKQPTWMEKQQQELDNQLLRDPGESTEIEEPSTKPEQQDDNSKEAPEHYQNDDPADHTPLVCEPMYLQCWSIRDLKSFAKSQKLKGYSKMTKSQIVEQLQSL